MPYSSSRSRPTASGNRRWESPVELARGDPVREVLEAVQEADVALLIVTTHRKAGIAGLIVGSFAAAAVGRTACPMLLVPIVGTE